MTYAVDFSKGKPRMGKPLILKETRNANNTNENSKENLKESVTKERKKIIEITDKTIKKRQIGFA